MPKIIIANVDSDSMCGCDMPPEIHALSSMCCDRLLVMAQDDDLVVLPHSVSQEYIDYVNELLGRHLTVGNVIVPREGDSCQLILNDDSIGDGFVADAIRERSNDLAGDWSIVAYFIDRPVMSLADDLGLPLHGLDAGTSASTLGFLRDGGAESFNSKVLFRQLASTTSAPVPSGRVATTPRELARALRVLLPETGRVIIKQDLNSGGAGNTAVTRFGDQSLTGATDVRAVTDDTDLDALATELWPGLAVQRTTRVVVEAYHRAAQVYYSELWVPGPLGSPKFLNFGEMRMEPTFIGFEIPGQRMSASHLADMTAHSMNLAREAGRRGFVGYMNIDSIVTEDGRLFFNEVNGRMGCCTNIDYLARALVGEDYLRSRVVLTYNWVEVGDFCAALKTLDEAGVGFDHAEGTGVIVAIEDVARTGLVDYMVIGRDAAHARVLEEQALAAFAAA